MTPYENLANAIILSAVTDYRKALRDLAVNDTYSSALQIKRECELFFRSDWFSFLTKVDGAELMDTLLKEVA